MKTRLEMIETLKAEYPTLRSGDDERGYTDLSADDYETTIEAWADNLFREQTELAEAEAIATAKLDAIEKLTALGIDPKALGL